MNGVIKMARKKDTFIDLLRAALDHYDDPDWLGRHSPLATPYFLGFYLRDASTSTDNRGRGQILQNMIQNAAAQLWQDPLPTSRETLIKGVNQDRAQQGHKSHRYFFYLLELRYLRHYFSSRTYPTVVKQIPDYVNVSETRFFEHLKQAINLLGQYLLQAVNPTLRLENPSLAATTLVGRDKIVEAILSDLQSNAAVAISGAGGLGKTSIATVVFNNWLTHTAFWYTFRPGLNDNLNSVLFALAHFLNQWEQSSLWLQLVANEGQIGDINQALGFLRQDLQALKQTTPLFCFDEVDLLQTNLDSPRHKTHIQLLEFLDSLRGLVPLILIGQKALLDTNTHYAIQPLSLTETAELLQLSQIYLSPDEQQGLHRRTNGNPRLLELYITLSQDQPTNITSLFTAPAVKPLFNRLWKHLNQNERYLLCVLCVFRTYAPRQIISNDANTINNLIKRNLIKTDQTGGIILLEAIRLLVYDALPTQQRQYHHQNAAHIRIQFGEYTSAAYHFKHAQEHEAAITLWYTYQDHETMRGQAGTAYDIFSTMPTKYLDTDARQKLKVIQDRLSLLVGDIQNILEGIETFTWHPDKEITADAHHQWGRANTIVGQIDTALDHYERAIETLTRLASKTARAHLRRGQILMEPGLQQIARQEVWLIHYEAELLEGLIEGMVANYEKARRHLQKALHYAQAANNPAKQARTYYWLAVIAGKQNQFDLARENALQAMTHFENTGDQLQLLQTRVELTGTYLNMKSFDKVIEIGEEILPLCQEIKYDRLISVITNHLAEAHMEKGNYESARTYAAQVLAQETPRSRPHALYTLGHIHERENNDLEQAEFCFKEGIKIANKNGDEYIEAYLQRDLGRVYDRQNRPSLALACTERALELFAQMGLPNETAELKSTIQAYNEI
jgi:tetratricopeptide (TPR) repeat protein